MLSIGTSFAQQRMSVEATTRQVVKNKSIRVERQIFYTEGGELVVHYTYPQEYYMKTNGTGEVVVYRPAANEVTMFHDNSMSSQSELLVHFLSPNPSDLGLVRMGFVLQKSGKEGQRVIRTYVPTRMEDKIYSKAVIVLEQGRPIYCAFYDNNANIVRKTYYDKYVNLPMAAFPTRVTQIAYSGVGDSVIRREEYKNVRTSNFPANALFDFQVPANAQRVNPFNN